MKSKKNLFLKITAVLICLVMIIPLTACGGGVSIDGFNSRTLANGKVGSEYEQSIAVEGENITYGLKMQAGNGLPSGLKLNVESGVISGKPTKAGTTKAILLASTKNETVEAEFTITIDVGTFTYSGSTLAKAKVGEPYLANLGTVSDVSKIKYEVKSTSTLPHGLVLDDETGALEGTPTTAIEGAAFIVIASAPGYESVEATFTLTIEAKEVEEFLGYIDFDGFTLDDGLVGQAYNQSVRRAKGVPNITYTFKVVNGIGLPSGLSYNSAGYITGTPTNSTAGQMVFRITAQAPGYDSVTVQVYLTVKDVYVQTSKFEAEYIDVSKLNGAGYSSSPKGKNMLQNDFSSVASNGYVLGYLHLAIVFNFEIESSAASTGTLKLRLSTELGTISHNPNTLAIRVNGVALNYGSFTITVNPSGQAKDSFQTITLSPKISLTEGINIIQFEIFDTVENPVDTTMTAQGPIFDYIEISDATSTLGWRPKLSNLS